MFKCLDVRLVQVCLIAVLLSVGPLLAQKAAIAVVEKKAGKVGFYASDGKRLSEVNVGVYPHEWVFSRDRRLLYISDNGVEWMTSKEPGVNTISVIDVANREKVDVIGLGRYYRPHSMAVLPESGHLIVTIENPHGLVLVDPVAKKVLRKYETKGEAPHMLVLGPNGVTAWASNANTGEVAVVNIKSGEVEKLIQTGQNPQGGVLTRDGKRLYLTNTASNIISVIDTSKREVIQKIQTGNGPARIVLDADEKTLVYNLMLDEAVGFADVESGKQTGIVKLPGQPLSISKSQDSRTVYLGIQEEDRIAVVSVPERKIVRIINTPPGAGPDTVAPL